MNFARMDEHIEIALQNGLKIDFVLKQNLVIGIGKVTLKGKMLRSDEECIMPEIATPDGIEAYGYELVDVEKRGDSVAVITKPCFRVGHRMEWSEHALHLRVNTSSWTRDCVLPKGSFLEWVIQEEKETFDGVDYIGFSYGFRYHCAGYPIYQIEDKATWELGGSAIGNTFMMCGGTNRPVERMEKDTYYFTGWDLPGIANPYIFQHMPLYTGLQGFTFQYDEEDVLVTVHEKPSHVRSLFQKEKGDSKLLHFNQFCFDLTEEAATPARKILVGKRAQGTPVTIINHYLRVRDTLQKRIRDYYNIKLDLVCPAGSVETWAVAEVEKFAPIFDQLHEWGFKRSYLMPLWRSNETEVVPRYKEDREKFGFMGNMCCPLELEIAECYGGWDGLKDILSRAVEHGMKTYMWFGSHFSSLSSLGNRIKDIFAKDVSGQNNRNNYGHVLFAVNQNSKGFQEYFFNAFKRAGECGLNGIFRDSHFNMASDTINYLHISYEDEQQSTTMDQIGVLKKSDKNGTDMVLSMHDTEIGIQSRLQNELGMLYYAESPGMIATARCGTDYVLTRGYEYMYSNKQSGINYDKVVGEFGDDVDMVYFKGLSARFIYELSVDVNEYPEKHAFTKWWNPETMSPMVKAFHKVDRYMQDMYVLDDGNGILWKGYGCEVIFAYKDFAYDFGNMVNATGVMSGQGFPAIQQLAAEKMKIYLICPRPHLTSEPTPSPS